MNPTRRLWITLGVIVLASFAVLGWMGREIHFAQPPIPDAVRSASGELLYTRADYDRGREVWQSTGLVGGLAAPRGGRSARSLVAGRGRHRP
jgi:nitric oxide reductase subunit B